MKPETISIEVPKVLAQHFLKMSEMISQHMGNAGCNDFLVEDTPDNRYIRDLAGARNFSKSLEDYYKTKEYGWDAEEDIAREEGEKICLADFVVFDLFASMVKDAVEVEEKCTASVNAKPPHDK